MTCLRTCFRAELGGHDPLWEARARIERLEADLSEFRNAAADEMIKLRAEIERLTQQKAGQK